MSTYLWLNLDSQPINLLSDGEYVAPLLLRPIIRTSEIISAEPKEKVYELLDDEFSDKHSDTLYVDLLIEDDDISFNEIDIPFTVNQRDGVAQDIKHMLLESSILTQLTAERNETQRDDLYLQVILLVESDQRIVPGTVSFEQDETLGDGQWKLTAQTYDFGTIEAGINV